MLLKILDYLVSRRYVELIHWTNEALERYGARMDENQKKLLQHIKHKEIHEILSFLKKLSYTKIEAETYELLLAQFSENEEDIKEQWAFETLFRSDRDYVNLILQENIIIFQEGIEISIEEDPNSLSLNQMKQALLDSNTLFINGKFYTAQGQTSIDKLQTKLRKSNVLQDLKQYKRYEKIIQFIDALDDTLQKMFSINHIGIIFYKEALFLVKWVQFLDEHQLLSEEIASTSKVTVLDDFGVRIGVQVKENLELGNLVIFTDKQAENNSEKSPLTPLFSLDEGLFSDTVSKDKHIKYNLKNEEDCKSFVNKILARIETGILLLTKKKAAWVKDPNDLAKYIQISLERIEGMASISQRLNVLRDLFSLSTDPSLIAKIQRKMERNYILYLKEQFSVDNIQAVSSILKSVLQYQLFEENQSLLVHTVVYLFDSYYADSDIIISSVEYLFSNWDLSEELIKILEKPQIVAITSKVAIMLNRGDYSSVVTYLTSYLKNHPKFSSFNILSLLLEVLLEIYQFKGTEKHKSITNNNYINFLRDFISSIHLYDKDISEKDRKTLVELIKKDFTFLSLDLDFIAYLDNKLVTYLTTLKTIDERYITKRDFYKIVRNIGEQAPLIMFHKKLPQVGIQVFEYLTKIYKDVEITLDFCSIYIRIFNKSANILKTSPDLLKSAAEIMLQIKVWIDTLNQTHETNIHPNFLLPIQKEIRSFLNNWYLRGELPEYDFAIHKTLIKQWVEYAGFEHDLENMYNILSIKDFIWACDEGNYQRMQKKYVEIPLSVYENNLDYFLEEIKRFLAQPYKNSDEFRIFLSVFNIIQEDIERIKITSQDFLEIKRIAELTFQNSSYVIIEEGKATRFAKTLTDIKDSIILFSPHIISNILEKFLSIYEMSNQEISRFDARVQMMGNMVSILGKTIQKYDQYFQTKAHLPLKQTQFLSKQDLELFIKKDHIDANILQIFQNIQKLILYLMIKEPIKSEKITIPFNQFLTNILIHFAANSEKIISDLIALSEEIFQNQKILNTNKKILFKSLLDIFDGQNYPEFNKKLEFYKDFVEKLSNLEALYYSIRRKENKAKIETAKIEAKSIIEFNPNLISPWIIYGNCLAIQEKYEDAIKAYNRALKCESSNPNYSRLYHNLLVAHLTLKQYDEAVSIVQNLDIGIKTNPFISDLIQRIEDITGKKLLQQT
ncbi:hypothetical protein NEF87_003340 [Candidatus Lokiarchaeum ossiferum]|uniref:Tetratricopeptide repeat protein n=1 Tax=Candidatus Lokiarchaeum ossiferum TaxID=2951803 RepID=A0ABY6HU51_9ARCH|nr:hypothetical protein NEF87_003340 [Candidatus Lokiarchaeum sp. B-35]